MKGKRFLAGLLTATMLITSPAVTKASLVDDDLVELNEIEQTEEPEPEEPAINPAEESMEESVEDDSGGAVYETDWSALKDEISNAISAFSLDEEEEPLESESTTKAEIFDNENGGDDLTSIFSKIGNYKLNWVGNENYYWKGNAGAGAIGIGNYENSLKTAYTKCDKNISNSDSNVERKAAAARVLGLSSSKDDAKAAKKIYNSSSCKITASSDTDRIYKAYLVWNTRVGHVGGYHYKGYTNKYTNSPNTVALVRPDGTAMMVKAKKTYKDSRQGDRQFGHLNAIGTDTELDTGAINCYYTYYTDVTSFVKGDTKADGYGNYTVCNIKPWDSDGHGGGCSCTWQLIFVEHRFDKVVTYTDINLGSYFAMPDEGKALYETNYMIPHTMKIPKGAEMQMMFGSGRGSAGTKGSATISKGDKTETVNTKYKTSTGKVTTAPPKSGIYCGDGSVDNLINEYGDTLYVLTGAKRNANDNAWSGDTITGRFVSLDGNWKSYSIFGMSIQLGTDFISDHDITIDQSNMSDATVKSTITNKSTDKYGIYDGTVTVELDDKLTVNKKADGSWDISTKGHGSLSSVKGNTVTFTGVRLVSKGDTFKYTIKCTTSTPGTYYTSDELKGKLYNGSDKSNPETNVKIDPACCGDDNDIVPSVNTVNIRYHLNATTEAHVKAVAGFEYDQAANAYYEQTPKNTPESMDYPYAIKSYDAVGFHANSGYKPGMTVGASNMVWTDSSGTVYNPGNVIYPTDDMDLYAHWIPDNSSPGGSTGGSNCYHFISYSGDTWDENNIIRHEFVTEPYKKLLPVPDKVKPGEKQTYHNEWFYYARSVPTPAVLDGWIFDGWIPASNVKESGGLYQDSSSYKLTSSTLSQEYAKNPTDTVFYAQYHRGLNTYFVQQKEIKKITKIVYRGSRDINKYEWKKLITSPRQILKNGWTACGWTTDADCMAAAECADGGTLYTDRFKNVYYGLYQRDVTISYDSNGYDPVKSMPNPDVKKAYIC